MIASNATFLDENTGGKGKYFRARILQAGLVKYSFGVCLLEKDTIDRFVYNFVGCPVIIDHKDVTNENAKEERVGVISRVWFEQMDGWYWVEGIIFDEKAISLIDDGYNVSCQYEISEYANNVGKKLHNGNPFDKVILNGKPEHLAIVKNPRYENAMIAVNALDVTEEDIPLDSPTEENVLGNIQKAINEIKETDMFSKLFKKKENKMDKDELKSLFMECLSELTAKNEADEEKEDDKLADDKIADNEEDDKKEEKKDEEKADNKCKNEVVDKRDIIRQIMAIAGKEEASEDVKEIAKLAEKLAYDKSEADKKADNKCKNEDDKDDDKKVENEEKEDEKEKASNSLDEIIGKMSAGTFERKSESYMTQKKAVELGDKLF